MIKCILEFVRQQALLFCISHLNSFWYTAFVILATDAETERLNAGLNYIALRRTLRAV